MAERSCSNSNWTASAISRIVKNGRTIFRDTNCCMVLSKFLISCCTWAVAVSMFVALLVVPLAAAAWLRPPTKPRPVGGYVGLYTRLLAVMPVTVRGAGVMFAVVTGCVSA